MKIGLIVPGFSADEKDWCVPAILNLARWLAATNEVHVFTLRYPHRRDSYKVFEASVHSLGGATRHGLSTAPLWASAMQEIFREHRRQHFDVLHSIWGSEAGFIAVLASRLVRVPSVVSLVGGELVALPDIGYGADVQPRQRMMNQFVLRFAGQILGGSRQSTELARSRLSPERKVRVRTLTLGVDTDLFFPNSASMRANSHGRSRQQNRSQWKVGSPRLLNVGSLIPVKDQATLLQATAIFLRANPTAALTIVGMGRLEPELRTLAASLGIAEHVHFQGIVPHDQLPPWYREADIYIQASRHEVQAMATLEAGASGSAIAGTNVGVLADLAAQGAAIAVPPMDPNALADGIERAQAGRPELGRQAAELVRSEYSLDRSGSRLIEVYANAAANNALALVDSLSSA